MAGPPFTGTDPGHEAPAVGTGAPGVARATPATTSEPRMKREIVHIAAPGCSVLKTITHHIGRRFAATF